MLILGKVLKPLYPKNLELRNGLGGAKVKPFIITQKAIICPVAAIHLARSHTSVNDINQWRRRLPGRYLRMNFSAMSCIATRPGELAGSSVIGLPTKS